MYMIWEWKKMMIITSSVMVVSGIIGFSLVVMIIFLGHL